MPPSQRERERESKEEREGRVGTEREGKSEGERDSIEGAVSKVNIGKR